MNAPTLPAAFVFPPAIRNSSATAVPNAAAALDASRPLPPAARNTQQTPRRSHSLACWTACAASSTSAPSSAAPTGPALPTSFSAASPRRPTNPRLAKTALGAERTVPWSHHNNNLDLATQLLAAGATLWALETTPAAVSLFAVRPPPGPLVLVVGNEVAGVDPGLLALCTQAVAIPMHGHKRSLNVATAFGIAASVLANLWYRSSN